MDERQERRSSQLDENHIKFFILQKSFDIASLVIRYLFWLGIAYIAYLSLEVASGKTTIANIVIGYFTSKESDFGAPWILTFFAFGWALLERKERRRKTQELQKRIGELEKRIDPNRTSSGLLSTGETNPKDDLV